MAGRTEVSWDTCRLQIEEECLGVRLDGSAHCWAHAPDDEIEAALAKLSETGQLDARGVTFTADFLARVLTAARRDEAERAVLGDARFDHATFTGNAYFNGATFTGNAYFNGATFTGNAHFDRATFTDDARFDHATFTGNAYFNGATFNGDAQFTDTTFNGDAQFNGATFTRTAWFNNATFTSNAAFVGATVAGDAGFEGAAFNGTASFFRSTFTDNAFFTRAVFESASRLGPMLVQGTMDLDDARFHERGVQIEVSAQGISCRRTRFRDGVHLRVRWAEVVLDDADLAAPSILSVGPPSDRLDEDEWATALQETRGIADERGRPRLLSVQRADVAGLTVSGVDLRACRFAGAHHLDQLRIDECLLGSTPAWWRTTRQAIAQEHHWRAGRDEDGNTPEAGGGWYTCLHRPSNTQDVVSLEAPTAAQVVALYRDLRKAREDAKDEPGAADFYYGEMDMRRHATRRRNQDRHGRRNRGATESRSAAAAVEHAILAFYWLVSGYGLRAWRAIAAVAALVLAGSVVFAFWGFAAPDEPGIQVVDVDEDGAPIYGHVEPQQPEGLDELPTALRFSAQAAASLLRGPDVPLTPLGEWLHLSLRLVGPILLGLAVLSVRGRVKR